MHGFLGYFGDWSMLGCVDGIWGSLGFLLGLIQGTRDIHNAKWKHEKIIIQVRVGEGVKGRLQRMIRAVE